MKGLLIAGVLVVLFAGPVRAAQEGMPASHSHDGGDADAMDSMLSMDAMGGMVSMSTMQPGMAAHMRLTAPRPPNEADRERAEQIVRTLRVLLVRYKDYHVAEQGGFKPIITQRPLPIYHFTNAQNERLADSSFNLTKPTSLLYSKTPGGFELRGVMYTAPQLATEDQLNARIPLSVARWHVHTNICLPPIAQFQTSDWSRFGFDGSISTADACRLAGGRMYPQIYGWMVHVYPFESTPEKIWAH